MWKENVAAQGVLSGSFTAKHHYPLEWPLMSGKKSKCKPTFRQNQGKRREEVTFLLRKAKRKNLPNVCIWKLRIPNVDIYSFSAKFRHFFANSNGILPIVHNRQDDTNN